MATGKVKWFNNAKGYGFIRPDNGGDDLFVHYSYINMDGYKTLKAGQEISYDEREAPKGQHAVNIREVNATADSNYQINLVDIEKPTKTRSKMNDAVVGESAEAI
jgi:CspA family cold shock protein